MMPSSGKVLVSMRTGLGWSFTTSPLASSAEAHFTSRLKSGAIFENPLFLYCFLSRIVNFKARSEPSVTNITTDQIQSGDLLAISDGGVVSRLLRSGESGNENEKVASFMTVWRKMQPDNAANMWNEALNKRLGTKFDFPSCFHLLCGRPVIDPSLPREEVNLIEWAMKLVKKGKLEESIDPFLEGKVRLEEMKKYCEITEMCLAQNGTERPTMGDLLWNVEFMLQAQAKDRKQQWWMISHRRAW
ncbi:unnamed protein product [Thlaspi arvense]|uniref:Uncharacterized protein n=1 Tax=Thlaspi arvense TaxID=13288 RepID=A0AAU9T5H5_THLAR|nr:unnamed protein product [Thlaspi arvense]